MNPMNLFDSYLLAVKRECLILSATKGILVKEDEAGNIWISEDGEECYKVRGWHTALNEVQKILKRKELLDIESAR